MSKELGTPGAGGKRRGGRRSKLAWRKNVDIGDVENFLEEQRLDERLGGAQHKDDVELFTVDTAGDALLQQAQHLTEHPVLSTRLRRRAALAAPPRCYRALENTSQVAPPTPPAAPRTTLRPARPLSQARLEHRRHETDQQKRRRSLARTSRRRFDADVWTQELCERRVEPSLVSEWLAAEVVQHHTPPARRVGRPSAAPARPTPPPVPVPHPGQSYNPSYQDHQALLADIADKEKLLIKKEKHLERVTTALYQRVKPAQAQSEWLKEMMSGLPEAKEMSGGEGARDSGGEQEGDSGDEYRAVNPPVRRRRKDERTRRNRREHKLQKQQATLKRLDRKKIADIYKLRFLEASLARTEERLARMREHRAVRRAARLATTAPTLNAHKHLPQDEHFLAPHELAPALREHQHTGNLLRERWESLQRRGALAPSRIFLRKKLRLKRFWKPGHKVTPADVARALADKPRLINKLR